MPFDKNFKDPGDTAIPGRKMPPPDTRQGPMNPQPKKPAKIMPIKPNAPLGPAKRKEH